ncbi:hypothetical protein [Xanthomonas sp. WHRI 7945]|nr:hypothetical protein [Xanthomonas campestris pv. campestris]
MEEVLRLPRFSKALAALSLAIALWKLITLSPYGIGFSLNYLASPSILYSFAFDLALAVGAILLWRGRPASRWLFAAQAVMTSAGWLATGGLSRLPFILIYLKGTRHPDAPAILAYMARPYLIFGIWCLFGWVLALACFACFRKVGGKGERVGRNVSKAAEGPTLGEIMRRRTDGS